MSRIALINARALLPSGWRDDACVVIEDGRVADVAGTPPADAATIDLGGLLLVPGFIDVQVNGGGGVLLNDAPSVEGIRTIAAAHRRFGTTGLLPTLISDRLEVVAQAIRAVDDAIEAGAPGVLGVHIEGPFISPARPGVHDPAFFRTLDAEAVELLASARHGRTLVTLAPEVAAPELIQRLTARGVLVSAGHSDADHATARTAIAHGLTGVTHLFNAMSQLAGREPGMVGAALEDDATFAGIIADGLHVDDASLRVALRAKGPERLMLVTDAMPTVGADIDGFLLQGRPIRRDGDRLTGPGGMLAGSTVTMAGAVAGMMRASGATLAEAVRMASATPAAFLGLAHRKGAIAPGFDADLTVMDEDFQVRETWIAGRATGALAAA